MVACAYGLQLVLCKHILDVLPSSAAWVGAAHHPPLWILALCQDSEIQKEGVSRLPISGVLQDQKKSNVHQARKKEQAVAFFVNGLPSDYGLQMNVVSDVSIDFGNF